MVAQLSSPPPQSNDVFSISDQALSDRLHFIEEIGFGNWGSVWLCKPKLNSGKSNDNLATVHDQKLAVKLVHRSKTPTTAARVRSLWNEMKIVKTFKSDPHPSIIPFHSFIITPSYALITMSYLPTLVPVEVDELKAREWFRFLLSGVDFLHKRGVVHNDIKPANILLSHKNIPVLVDFGFAEKYDLYSDNAFHSNLSYGTPEYLSPERARGLPHDTRKSDVWSLGVTFFEILIGRTPFENSDGEQFITKDDLERYWSRTFRGQWVGEWQMSKGMEQVLRRMIAPNADLRCTISSAMNDTYWAYGKEKTASSHRRSSSYTSSIVFEKDARKLMEATRPSLEEDIPYNPPGLDLSKRPSDLKTQIPQLSRVKSQAKVAAAKSTPRKRILPVAELSPAKGSPRTLPFSSAAGKENIRTFNALVNSTNSRRALGTIANRQNNASVSPYSSPKQVGNNNHKEGTERKNRGLGDITSQYCNRENINITPSVQGKKKNPVRDRVKEWERERERMREMSRLEELERESDEMAEQEKIKKERHSQVGDSEKDPLKQHAIEVPPTPSTPGFSPMASSFSLASGSASARRKSSFNESGINVLRHNIRRSIDKTVNFYKSTTSQLAGRSTPLLTLKTPDDKWKNDVRKDTWEDDVLLYDAPAGISSAQQAVQDAADARMDRLTIWMRSVEKVVEDARQNFASSTTQELKTLPSLPVAPMSRSHSRSTRTTQLPRKILAASEIFSDQSFDASNISGSYATTVGASTDPTSDGCDLLQSLEIGTPSRRRRATVSICSPIKAPQLRGAPERDTPSPSKRREKSRSHGNLFATHIAPISVLEAELNKKEIPPPPPSAYRLSEVLNSNLFIAPPLSPKPLLSPHDEDEDNRFDMRDMPVTHGSKSFNDLTSSPLHVEPYPTRRASMQILSPDTPTQRRIEGVYDRFLMATSGVKRLGKGYQSDNNGPTSSKIPTSHPRPEKKVFHPTRKPMPPPVSSHDQRMGPMTVDELGVVNYESVSSDALGGQAALKEDGRTSLVRRAFKAMVPNNLTTSSRLSRIGA